MNYDNSSEDLSHFVEEEKEIKGSFRESCNISEFNQNTNKEILYIETISEKQIINPRKIQDINKFNVLSLKKCGCAQLLIVEDDISLRKILCEYANKMKINYEQADNGLVALELVTEKSTHTCCKTYKLILMDYMMPIMNGFESATKIKNFLSLDNLFACTHIILLSGFGDNEETILKDRLQSPFTEIIEKPLSFIRFKDLIKNYM